MRAPNPNVVGKTAIFVSGIYGAAKRCMRDPRRPVPQSYDEIVRKTVPDPDTSQRPTARQEQLAREGFRAMDTHEFALHARVIDALENALCSTNDTFGFEVEVDRDTITLHGTVHDVAMMSCVERVVEDVEGVGLVINRLVIA
jgi:hypothetical protein